jgi:hypothetical protein
MTAPRTARTEEAGGYRTLRVLQCGASPSPTFALERTEIDFFVRFSRVNSLGCHT